MLAYQFQIDGREAAPIRSLWIDAARDAVNAGYATWTGSHEIKHNDQCSIERVEVASVPGQ